MIIMKSKAQLNWEVMKEQKKDMKEMEKDFKIYNHECNGRYDGYNFDYVSPSEIKLKIKKVQKELKELFVENIDYDGLVVNTEIDRVFADNFGSDEGGLK